MLTRRMRHDEKNSDAKTLSDQGFVVVEEVKNTDTVGSSLWWQLRSWQQFSCEGTNWLCLMTLSYPKRGNGRTHGTLTWPLL